MQLVLLLDQNIILQTVVNTFDFALKVTHTGKKFRTMLITIIRSVNNRIDGLASLIVFSDVPLNFIRNGIELLRNRFSQVLNCINRAFFGLFIRLFQALLKIKVRPDTHDRAQGIFFSVSRV